MTKSASATRYSPVGRCIYCGSTDQLGDEHIIAAGLGGEWILPDASCRCCEGRVSSIEGYCLRRMMHGTRVRLGLRRRRRKTQPLLWADVTRDGKEMSHLFSPSDHPTVLCLPFLATPIILGGTGGIAGMWMYKFHLDWRALKHHGISGMSVLVNIYRFNQMLAKIGHSYAFAELGGQFEPLLLDVIKHSPSDCFHLVGGKKIDLPSVPDLHTLGITTINHHQKRYVLVEIRLFARYGGPMYQVVVGELEQATRTNSLTTSLAQSR
jgi:hypothetical protein